MDRLRAHISVRINKLAPTSREDRAEYTALISSDSQKSRVVLPLCEWNAPIRCLCGAIAVMGQHSLTRIDISYSILLSMRCLIRSPLQGSLREIERDAYTGTCSA